MLLFKQIYHRARAKQQKIVLPEGNDIRTIEAAVQIQNLGIAAPVLLGNPDSIRVLYAHSGKHKATAAQAADNALSAITLIEPRTDRHFNDYAAELFKLRQHKGRHKTLSRQQACEQAANPLMYGALMLRLGDADGYVAGAVHPTAEVLRAALQIIGMAASAKLVSSFFIMEHDLPHQAVQGACLYADCAMVIDPTAEELADIALTTAKSARELLQINPRVALLSFSTAGSASHPHVDKVRAAGELIKAADPSLTLLPEVQFDAAILPDILASKAPDLAASIADDDGAGVAANIFIFPELQSANIGYKIAQRIGGVRAVGPILQGLKQPVNDLSRGASVEDIVQLVAVTAVQAQNQH